MNSGASLEDIQLIDDEVTEQFNKNMELFFFDERLSSKIINHEERQEDWRFPQKYNILNLREYFLDKCKTEYEKERVILELELYKKKRMEKLLRWCIYFMDLVNEKKLFVGVGRGSSVASYCLFLIEMHMVDSIEYDLDPKEFFKEL